MAAQAQQQTLTPRDGAAGDAFGVPIATSGNTLVVGVTGDDVTRPKQGSARVFVRTGGTWTERQTLTASDVAPSDGFGAAVPDERHTIMVGAAGHEGGRRAVDVFVERGGVWTEEQKLIAGDRARTISSVSRSRSTARPLSSTPWARTAIGARRTSSP